MQEMSLHLSYYKFRGLDWGLDPMAYTYTEHTCVGANMSNRSTIVRHRPPAPAIVQSKADSKIITTAKGNRLCSRKSVVTLGFISPPRFI
jgi:hypothetical protein